jgi:hypothetical protein
MLARKLQPLFIGQHSYINRYQMMIKNENVKYLIRHIIPLALFEAASFGYMLLRERRVLVIWFVFIKGLPNLLLRKRKQIMMKRKAPFQKVYSFFMN